MYTYNKSGVADQKDATKFDGESHYVERKKGNKKSNDAKIVDKGAYKIQYGKRVGTPVGTLAPTCGAEGSVYGGKRTVVRVASNSVAKPAPIHKSVPLIDPTPQPNQKVFPTPVPGVVPSAKKRFGAKNTE